MLLVAAALPVARLVASTDSLPAAGAGTAPSWRAVQVAGEGAVPGFLDGVTCTSPASCIAVGNEVMANGSTRALVETTTATGWKKATLALPGPAQAAALFKVACPVAGNCVAVGYWSSSATGGPLVETLSAGKWSVVAAPPVPAGAVGAFLVDVACPAAGNCVAVGDTYANSAESGDRPWAASLVNGKWVTAPAPLFANLPGFLSGISCPVAGECVAVGVEFMATGTKTLVASLRGGQWSLWPSPGSGPAYAEGLTSVACQAPMSCVAAGELGGPAPTILTTRAGQWAAVSGLPPDPAGKSAGLWGLWCKAARCVGVGALSSVSDAAVNNTDAGAIVDPQGALIEQGASGHWSPATLPSGLPADSGLEDVTCTAQSCVAVGMTGQAVASGTSTAHTLLLETALTGGAN
ncbi:MAG TPA: hypothetical protein VL984_12295 [Acidimicrobiales bacterium]|nr:hypothetical protein [Acidimicrobiales bacterium]